MQHITNNYNNNNSLIALYPMGILWAQGTGQYPNTSYRKKAHKNQYNERILIITLPV